MCVSPSRFFMAQECVTRNSFEILEGDNPRTKSDILLSDVRVSAVLVRRMGNRGAFCPRLVPPQYF